MKMWKVEPAEIEKKIARHPWVGSVLVRREFPRRVVIEVEERTPKAIVAMGKLYYVDADGIIFKEVGEGENVNFPLLTGLRSERLATANPAMRQKIQDAMRLGELMTKDSHTLSEIHFDASEHVVLYTRPIPWRCTWAGEIGMTRSNDWIACWRCGKGTKSGSLRWM
jgi:cell division septal protein FtsQ